MDIYKVCFEENTEGELYGISIVDDPANKYNFLAFSNQEEIKLKAVDSEKKLLTGVVLIPNQRIKRFTENKGMFEVFFEAETIEKVSQDFFKKGYHRNSTFNHLEDLWLKGTTIVESWIVEDSNNDKSNALGFKNIPKGTWMISMKLSDELWEEYIKTGKARGFSIDAYMQLEKVQLNNLKLKKEKMSLLTKVLKFLAQEDDMKSIDIEGLGKLYAESFEVDSTVYQDLDGELVEAKTISFTNDGYVYLTNDNGVIISKDEFVAELPAEDVLVEDVEVVSDVEEVIEETSEDTTEEAPVEEVLTEQVDELKAEIEALKEELDSVNMKLQLKNTEVLELKKLPRDTKLKAINLSSVSKSTESPLEALSRITKSNK